MDISDNGRTMKHRVFFIFILFCLSFLLIGCDLFKDSDEGPDEGNYGDIGRLELRGYKEIFAVTDIVISPDDKHVYVASEGSTPPATSIHPNSSIDEGSRAPLPLGEGVISLRRDKDIGWLNGGSLDDYDYVGFPTSVLVSPDGKYVYVNDTTLQTIVRFVRDSDTGRLSSPVSKQVNWVERMFMPKDGAHIYYMAGGEIHWLKRDFSNGTLSGDPTDDFIFIANLYNIAFSPQGEHVYVGAWEKMHWFERDFGTGKLRGDLTRDHYYSTSSDFTDLVVSNDGKFVYVSDNVIAPEWPKFVSFDREIGTGALSNYRMIFDNFGGGNFSPETIVMSKDGLNIYLYNSWDMVINMFMIEFGGNVREIGSVGDGGYNVFLGFNSMIISSDGKHVYTGSWSGGPNGMGVVGFFTRQTDYKN